MPRCSDKASTRAVAAAVAVGAVLAGCSDIYYDRRETVSFAASDAIAANQAVQTIDPWSPASANRDIPVNGEVVHGAIERYRTGRVIPPRGTGTSSAGYNQQQPQSAGAAAPATAGAPIAK